MNYKCCGCGLEDNKLWRQYGSMDNPKLLCAECACRDQGEDNKVDSDGRMDSEMGCTDQIGWLVPAVPNNDRDGDENFWGYTTVPQDLVDWWRSLPT